MYKLITAFQCPVALSSPIWEILKRKTLSGNFVFPLSPLNNTITAMAVWSGKVLQQFLIVQSKAVGLYFKPCKKSGFENSTMTFIWLRSFSCELNYDQLKHNHILLSLGRLFQSLQKYLSRKRKYRKMKDNKREFYRTMCRVQWRFQRK